MHSCTDVLICRTISQGCGSIFTSANDFIRWVQALMNKEPPVSDDLYEGLVKVRWKVSAGDEKSPDDSPAGYAAGLEVQYVHGFKLIAHGGLVSGFHSVFFFLPDFKFGAVLLANAGDDNARENSPANMVAIEILLEFLKEKHPPGTASGEKDEYPLSKLNREQRHSKRALCPEHKEAHQLQDLPLNAYTGQYCNPGYHCLTVSTTESEALFIDGTDRSLAFTARFEHVCNHTIFIAHLADYWEGGDNETPAEFEMADGEAVRMGILFEDELDEFIWFDKVVPEERVDQVVMKVE